MPCRNPQNPNAWVWLARFAWRLVSWACLLLAAAAGLAHAQEIFREGTGGDAVCTRCHGAGEKKPILSVHQTRHGVGSQPGCQACHGSSRAHVQHTDDAQSRPPTDFVFSGANRSSAEVQSRTCLNCHKGGGRSHWPGSIHAAADLGCGACHVIHQPQDKVLDRVTQREVCYACHAAQRAQAGYLSTHPMAGGAGIAGEEQRQRNLPCVPRGARRTFPLGTSASLRRLRHMPRLAWLQHRPDAEGSPALALPKLPRRHRAYQRSPQWAGSAAGCRRFGRIDAATAALVHQLPLRDPRQQPPVRRLLGVRHPGTRLPAPALRRLWPRQARGVQCKRRGFCPSCGARRMAQTAAHLVEHVIPRVPVRQWVLSLPISLRLLLARAGVQGEQEEPVRRR